MNILNTHVHELIIYIDKDAPSKYMELWKEFKTKCEDGNRNEHIVEQLKDYCKLNANRILPYLDKEEGGLGGNDNLNNKQIRFRIYYSDNDNDIILNKIESTDNEKWTYDELDDLLSAFIKTANSNIKANYVNGRIRMFNRRMLDDNYLESDSE